MKIRINQINQKAVLITGCSSGIGRATAIYLAKRGFMVFATVRKETDAQDLRKLGETNLVPICPLDLTRLEQISQVRAVIERELESRGIQGLFAIINNAGGGGIAPIELMDLEKFRIELETRILGPVGLLQEFLPLIRQGQGRILWIVTPALIPIPYVSTMHICDFAVNCLVRTLKLELSPWRIPCVMIRCGGVMTEAPGKSQRELQDMLEKWPRERLALYQNALQREVESFNEFDKHRSAPQIIAATVFKALNSKRPRLRYQVGYMSRTAELAEFLPQAITDLVMANRG